MPMKNGYKNATIWWQALIRPDTAGRLVLGEEDAPGFDSFFVPQQRCALCDLWRQHGAFPWNCPGPYVQPEVAVPIFSDVVRLSAHFLSLLNCLIGSRLRFRQCLRLLLIATSTNAIALGSYAFVSYFFTLTTFRSGYHFLVLMHVFVFAIPSFISILVIIRIFRATAAAKGAPPRRLFVLGWGVLYGCVGVQMAWLMRPWIGTFTVAYSFFRTREGSFFESVWSLLF